MNTDDLIRQFQEQRYAASALPGLDGPAVAELLGERIRRSEAGQDVVEVSVPCVCQCRERARSLVQKFGEWLAGRGYRLEPVECEGQAIAGQEWPGDDRAAACFQIVEVKK